ncbi:MAG: hypothetical protein JWN32_4096 [Solirubrobacterales bacterium]|nr:hypothetical protein [Solirubrobacterales bacterium]
MAEIKITLDDAGRAYVSLSPSTTSGVRVSVALDGLEQADAIPALGVIALDFDHYRRLVGIEIQSAADSVLPPALLDDAERI